MKSFSEIFPIFLKLGLTYFGGPVAHIGYFRKEFVGRRKWLDEQAYADLISLCQFLPGPASSQVGMALGLSRGGLVGALFAWLGFTLPSAILLILFGIGFHHFQSGFGGWLQGLEIASVSVVAQAVWSMTKPHFSDWRKIALILASAACSLLNPFPWMQILIIVAGGIVGLSIFQIPGQLPHEPLRNIPGRGTGFFLLFTFLFLLLFLPILASFTGSDPVRFFASFYRAGSLVFGGGHVVLPLLQSLVVMPGWVSSDEFLAGYGAAQAVPGPIFTFAAYLGAISNRTPSGWVGGFIALFAIFLPSFLLVAGILPFWEKLRSILPVRQAMPGIHCAVAGLLLAAFYHPVCTTGIRNGFDFTLAVFGLFMLSKIPAWAVVLSILFIAAVFHS
ncbi:MAG: chromate efflux transporter [Burkholderiales bacterium]|nr:chromate efflux transporter [Burkholderiales bacterium]